MWIVPPTELDPFGPRETRNYSLNQRAERVLALAVRLLDVGMFRVGSAQYAEEDSGIGLATIREQHVQIEDDAVAFD